MSPNLLHDRPAFFDAHGFRDSPDRQPCDRGFFSSRGTPYSATAVVAAPAGMVTTRVPKEPLSVTVARALLTDSTVTVPSETPPRSGHSVTDETSVSDNDNVLRGTVQVPP